MPCRIARAPSPNSLMLVLAKLPPLSVYLHWPYCATICPYCDFNVHKARAVDEPQWRLAFRQEMEFAKTLRCQGPVETIYLGGGTPSLMSPDLIYQILNDIDQVFGISEKAEISKEANPEGLDENRVTEFRAAGVNRVSLGVQSLDDEALTFLGRRHNSATAIKIFEAARRIFPKVSLDLIYARPDQTQEMWEAELNRALEMAPSHLSLYELTIEPNTAFGHKARRGDLMPLPEDPSSVLYELTQDMCAAHGMPAYEVSNHALPGHACLHNVASWQGGDYIGLGPGAHGRLTSAGKRLATQAIAAPQMWLASVAEIGHGWSYMEALDQGAAQEERLLLGLRLATGINSEDLSAFMTAHVNSDALAGFCDNGYLIFDKEGLRATPKGWLVLDYLTGQLLRTG